MIAMLIDLDDLDPRGFGRRGDVFSDGYRHALASPEVRALVEIAKALKAQQLAWIELKQIDAWAQGNEATDHTGAQLKALIRLHLLPAAGDERRYAT